MEPNLFLRFFFFFFLSLATKPPRSYFDAIHMDYTNTNSAIHATTRMYCIDTDCTTLKLQRGSLPTPATVHVLERPAPHGKGDPLLHAMPSGCLHHEAGYSLTRATWPTATTFFTCQEHRPSSNFCHHPCGILQWRKHAPVVQAGHCICSF